MTITASSTMPEEAEAMLQALVNSSLTDVTTTTLLLKIPIVQTVEQMLSSDVLVLVRGHTVWFNVTLTNWLGASSTPPSIDAAAAATRGSMISTELLLDQGAIQIESIGGVVRRTQRSQSIKLSSRASLSAVQCDGAGGADLTQTLRYTWFFGTS